MIKLISTDFDGTLFAEFENPPIPVELQELIAGFQAGGGKWVINTGRDLSSLMEGMARSRIEIKPDYFGLVEREIYIHKNAQYASLDDWNLECYRAHEQIFRRVRADLPRLVSWVDSQFDAMVYEDAYSPFCLVAGRKADADAIQVYMEEYCGEVPGLQVVRNDVYSRFAHSNYDKGTVLAEISRRLGITAEEVFAVGDHYNDLPMLKTRYARYLAAPSNAIEPVKQTVREQGGYVSELSEGRGVAEALRFFLKRE